MAILSLVVLLVAFVLGLLLGAPYIGLLRRLKMGKNIRREGPQSHLAKQGTPTLGGALVIPVGLLRKLRGGHWVAEDNLDLHGMNRVEAAAAVAAFLRRCLARRLRCVRIVHGKGLGSRNREPVLKAKLRKWLALRDEVLAFCQAPAADGGGGAVLVLLKTAR